MNRREFLMAGGAFIGASVFSNFAASGAKWTIGCFNRPWTKWGGIDVALHGIKEAGFSVMGLLSRSKTEPFIGADATAENENRRARSQSESRSDPHQTRWHGRRRHQRFARANRQRPQPRPRMADEF